jgi:hypothetical protein
MQVFIKDAPHKENIYDNISRYYNRRKQIVKRFTEFSLNFIDLPWKGTAEELSTIEVPLAAVPVI